MTIRIASIRGIDKLSKKNYWNSGFRIHNDIFSRYLDINFNVDDVDCFFQFNIFNPYKTYKTAREPQFKKILDSQKPYIVWEEGSFRQFPQYKKVGWYHYNNNGKFNNESVDDFRWKKFLSKNKLKIKDWKSKGDYILIMGQIEYDSALISMYDTGYKSFIGWIENTIKTIRKYSDRSIVIRPHPKDLNQYIVKCKKIVDQNLKVSISTNFSSDDVNKLSGGDGLYKDLSNAYCVITYNSNSIVEAVCEGIPVFALDQGSPAYDIAHHDLSLIENLDRNKDIYKWCSQIAYTMWNSDEIAKGETWAHLKPVYF